MDGLSVPLLCQQCDDRDDLLRGVIAVRTIAQVEACGSGGCLTRKTLYERMRFCNARFLSSMERAWSSLNCA